MHSAIPTLSTTQRVAPYPLSVLSTIRRHASTARRIAAYHAQHSAAHSTVPPTPVPRTLRHTTTRTSHTRPKKKKKKKDLTLFLGRLERKLPEIVIVLPLPGGPQRSTGLCSLSHRTSSSSCRTVSTVAIKMSDDATCAKNRRQERRKRVGNQSQNL
eukprot:233071-Rhodomonas_salina.1